MTGWIVGVDAGPPLALTNLDVMPRLDFTARLIEPCLPGNPFFIGSLSVTTTG
jgi:hypothetical protein